MMHKKGMLKCNPARFASEAVNQNIDLPAGSVYMYYVEVWFELYPYTWEITNRHNIPCTSTCSARKHLYMGNGE
jgi:hypothetical protein